MPWLSYAVSYTLLQSVGIAPISQQVQVGPVFRDGMAQTVEAFADRSKWIREHLWVETEFDSDQDGKKDRVHVDVTRPAQTEEGLKVPVIYESSPYFAGTAGGNDILWDVRHELGEEPPARTSQPKVPFDPNRTMISNSLTTSWVPRGFAVVHSEAPGTGLSSGSPTVGGEPERLAPKAVIDWLNGRAKGFTTKTGNEQVYAKWCTGKVGMIGTSYNGTIPVAAATTGVDGLEAIIPVAPNTSYYHYYRSNGLVRHPGGWLGEDIDSLYDFINSGDPENRAAGDRLYRNGLFAKFRDRKTGDYNEFWKSRDLLPHVKNIKCAVLMAHAFNDWNVVPEHSYRISAALKGRVPLVQYFHQGGHGGDPPFELVNKWFTRFLYGVENGIENGPKSYIVREPGEDGRRGALTEYPDYPHPEAKMVSFYPSKGGNKVGNLQLEKAPGQKLESLFDNVEYSAADLAQLDASENRLIYATGELKAPVHISGVPKVSVRMAASKEAVNLSVYLVQLPYAKGREGTQNLITRGWADPQNADSLKGDLNYHSLAPGKPLTPGKFVSFKFCLQPDDQVIPAGKRIGLMLLSSDKDFTIWPKPGSKLTFDLDSLKIEIPIVGGESAFKKALSEPVQAR